MKKTQLFFLAVSLLVSMLYITAYAEDTYYAGASAGRTDASDWCSGFSGSCDDRGKGFKVYGGIQVTENFGAEFSYLDLGEVSIGKTSAAVARLDGFSISGVAAWPLSEQFDLFLKAGFFKWNLDAGVSADGTDESYGLGARFKISDRIGLRAEWERFKEVGNAKTGESDVDLISVGGIVYF